MKNALLLLSLLMMTACNDSSTGSGSANTTFTPSCVTAQCRSKQRILEIPGAENVFFTDGGRLFVTGNANIYEVVKESGEFRALPRSVGTAGGSGFGGMAQRGDTLYVNVFDDGGLWAARLTEAPEFSLIHPLGLTMPNGLAAGPSGELYVVNGPLELGLTLPDPKVVRVQFSASDAMQVVEQSDWLSLTGYQPNGIASVGRSLFITASRLLPPALGVLLRVDIAADGSAGEPEELFQFTSIPDDLSVAGDALLLSFFSEGAVAVVSQDGDLLSRSEPLSFDSPSQLRLGRPPLFEPTDILVSEKGLLIPNPLPYGNALSLYRLIP
ncbi:hypothetical protein [Spongiibacter marinus]|uniref:hypothetical protein n=1 Tax=Spongiibacter marinus TaxID=354246 RepID=UPI003566665B